MKKAKKERINIILEPNSKITLMQICNKYKLSMSTTIRIIVENYERYLAFDPKLDEELKTEYLFKSGQKTSIKMSGHIKNYEMRYLSNIIYLFTSDKKFSQKEKIKNDAYREFSKTVDRYYNYNQLQRNLVRFIKKNKPYVKELMEQ